MLLIAVSAHVDAERPLKADRLAHHISVDHTSPLTFALQQYAAALERQRQSVLMTPVEFPRIPRMSRSFGPVREIQFLGGDRITAEIVRWEGDRVELRTRRGQVTLVPRASIASVSLPPREQELFYEPFEHMPPADNDGSSQFVRPEIPLTRCDTTQSASGHCSLSCTSDFPPITYRFPAALETSRIQFWFLIGAPPAAVVELEETGAHDAAALRVDLDFEAAGAMSQWTIRATHDRANVIGVRGDVVNSQTVLLDRGWHCVTVVLESNRSLIAIDETLLVSTARSPGPLAALAISSKAVAWIDDLLVSQTNVPGIPREIRPSSQDDCIALHDGEEWFGRIKQVSAAQVAMSTSIGDRTVAWSRMERLVLNQSGQQTSSPIGPRGLCSRIRFQSVVDRPELAADRLVGTIVSISPDYCLVNHSWLGDLAVSWSDIEKIEPCFYGQWIQADSRQQHLGTSIRDDFHRPVPDGTEWTVEFNVPDPIPERAEFWLSLDAVDLEPAGPGTPLASPWLKELRAGKLLTRVDLNKQPAGDLNRWIRFRAPVASPENLRCRLPPGIIQPGLNTLTLSQVALNASGVTDNCELSNLRIDIVVP